MTEELLTKELVTDFPTAKDLTLEEIDLLWVEDKEGVINSQVTMLEEKRDIKENPDV